MSGRAGHDPESPVSGPFLGAAIESVVEALPAATKELAQIDSGDSGVGERILEVAGDIVLAHLKRIRLMQMELAEIPRADANFALRTLQVVQRAKELSAWTGALSHVDGDELREALKKIKEMKQAERIISHDKFVSDRGSDPQ